MAPCYLNGFLPLLRSGVSLGRDNLSAVPFLSFLVIFPCSRHIVNYAHAIRLYVMS